MKRAELEKAAFWEHEVCLDCGATFDPEDVPDAADGRACPECGSLRIAEAAPLLRLIDSLEVEDVD